jgi:molybdate transport system ATP-binding protein
VSLTARLGVNLGQLDLDVELAVADGEVVAVVGPNGAGKTTLLRALAGLIPLNRGRVEVDGLVLEDTVNAISVPPEGRPIGMLFQDYLLFPHLSALDNVAYGLRTDGGLRRGRGSKGQARRSKAEARRLAQEWLTRVGMADHAGTRPRALSGGQAQRVALARVLAPQPRLLLLDEPLSAVDLSARAELRRLLRDSLAGYGGTRLLVTHDPLEALALADRLVVLEDGRTVQEGPVAEVTARPRSPWVAAMVGLNLWRGRAGAGEITLSEDARIATTSPVTGEAFAVVHPNAVTLYRARPDTSARNVWPGRVTSVDFEGDRVRVRIDSSPPVTAEVTPAAVADLRLVEGGPVWVSIKATEVAVYPT